MHVAGGTTAGDPGHCDGVVGQRKQVDGAPLGRTGTTRTRRPLPRSRPCYGEWPGYDPRCGPATNSRRGGGISRREILAGRARAMRTPVAGRAGALHRSPPPALTVSGHALLQSKLARSRMPPPAPRWSDGLPGRSCALPARSAATSLERRAERGHDSRNYPAIEVLLPPEAELRRSFLQRDVLGQRGLADLHHLVIANLRNQRVTSMSDFAGFSAMCSQFGGNPRPC